MERWFSLSNSGRNSRCGAFRANPLGRGLSSLDSFPFLLKNRKILQLNSNLFLGYFADRAHVALKLSHVNVPALNYLLRLEIYVTEDGQLCTAHLVLGYQPLTRSFQAIGHAIKAGSPRLAKIDVSKPKFLARQDLNPVMLPGVQNPPPVAQLLPPDNLEVAAQPEEKAESSRLSLKEEIDKFYFEEDIPKAPLIELSDPEEEQDRNSVVGAPIVIAYSEDSSDEEVDNMAPEKRKSLRELMAT